MYKKMKYKLLILCSFICVYIFFQNSVYAMTQKEVGEAIATFAINFQKSPDGGQKWTYDWDAYARSQAYHGNKMSDGTYHADCVGWVSMCLHQSIGLDAPNVSDGSCGFVVPSQYSQNYSGFGTVIVPASGALMPGDILQNNEHVMVYVGNINGQDMIIHSFGSPTLNFDPLAGYGPGYQQAYRISESFAASLDKSQVKTTWNGSSGDYDFGDSSSSSGSGSGSSGGGLDNFEGDPNYQVQAGDKKKNFRIVSINDKLPIYKHILLTEKYNFNKIKWKMYGHGNEEGKNSPMQSDITLGLKYPKDDNNTKLGKFVSLVLPYIQTWYIPLSMYSGILNAESGNMLFDSEDDNDDSGSGGSSSGSTGEAASITAGETIDIPPGYGDFLAYMGWQLITAPDSNQYKLREAAGMNFDSEGYGIINGRYVIACTTTFGQVGDYVDFYQSNGHVFNCIIGDIKNPTDPGCNTWGHKNGSCIVEFVVDNNRSFPDNPGTPSNHPEWGGQTIVKAVNGGSYYDNPNFVGNASSTTTKEPSTGNTQTNGDANNSEEEDDDAGTESDVKTSKAKKNVNFPYAIIKNGYHEIIVNRYDIQKYIMNTKYKDYIQYTKKSEAVVKETTIKTVNDKGEETSSSTHVIVVSCNPDIEVSQTPVNTRLDASGAVDPMKEEFVGSSTSTSTKYYLKEALTFDMVYRNEFTYTKYNEADVQARRNAKSESVSGRSPYNEIIGGNTKLDSAALSGSGSVANITSTYGASATQTDVSTSSTKNLQSVTRTYKLDGAQYTENVGEEIYIKREWEDKLTQTLSENKPLDYDEMLKYNENENKDKKRDTISKEDFESAPKKEYRKYKVMSKKGNLNLIDFINANPKIYKNYLNKGMEASKYMGYIKEDDLLMSYDQLKKLINKTRDSSGAVPYAYFVSLGFKMGYSNSGSIESDASSKGSGFGWPVDLNGNDGARVINCVFPYSPAYGESHGAIDINPGEGANIIIAAKDGKILRVEDTASSGGYGNSVVIEHSDGYYTRYSHMSSIEPTITEGLEVKKGQALGIMGTTGKSTGVHLDFTIYQGGTSHSNRIDPLDFYVTEPEYGSIDPNTITSIPSGYMFKSEKRSGGALGDVTFFTKYESGDDAYGQTGGDGGKACGKYQFDYRYALLPFIQSVASTYPEFQPFANLDRNSLMGNQALFDAWKAVYAKDPEGFKAAQDQFAYDNYYLVAEESLKSMGIDISGRPDVVKGSVFSYAIQHGSGSAAQAVVSAGITSSTSDRDFIEKIYNYRIANFSAYSTRYNAEKAEALSLL